MKDSINGFIFVVVAGLIVILLTLHFGDWVDGLWTRYPPDPYPPASLIEDVPAAAPAPWWPHKATDYVSPWREELPEPLTEAECHDLCKLWREEP